MKPTFLEILGWSSTLISGKVSRYQPSGSPVASALGVIPGLIPGLITNFIPPPLVGHI